MSNEYQNGYENFEANPELAREVVHLGNGEAIDITSLGLERHPETSLRLGNTAVAQILGPDYENFLEEIHSANERRRNH